jgi:hypothetical protein
MPFGLYFQRYSFFPFFKEEILCYVISHVLKEEPWAMANMNNGFYNANLR